MEYILNEQNFDEVVGEGVVLVDFYADWCAPCKKMLPVVEKIANEGKFKVGKVNIDEQEELASRFNIMSIPAFIVFKDGKRVDSLNGLTSKENLVEKLEKAL